MGGLFFSPAKLSRSFLATFQREFVEIIENLVSVVAISSIPIFILICPISFSTNQPPNFVPPVIQLPLDTAPLVVTGVHIYSEFVDTKKIVDAPSVSAIVSLQ